VKKEILESHEDIVIVGHLPFLGRLAASLLTGRKSPGVVVFQQGEMMCLERGEDSFRQVAWMIIPEILP